MTQGELVTAFDGAGIAVNFVGLIIYYASSMKVDASESKSPKAMLMSQVPQILFTSTGF